MPAAFQAGVYGDGLFNAARRASRRAASAAPRSPGDSNTRTGKPRKHLADSIRAVRVAWKFGGERVPKSAAIVLAEQPHAHLVERGTVRMRARPFLEPAIRSQSVLSDFRTGAGRSFARTARRLETGKLTARERKAARAAGW